MRPDAEFAGAGEVVTARWGHFCAGCRERIAPSDRFVAVRFRGGRWDRRHARPECGSAPEGGHVPLAVGPGGGLFDYEGPLPLPQPQRSAEVGDAS